VAKTSASRRAIAATARTSPGLQRSSSTRTKRAANGTRKKPMFSIAFGTSSE
jgi:hypothetical protein